MARVLVDTNVLISFLTTRDPAQQALATKLLESAAAGSDELLLHQLVLTEVVFVLGRLYGAPPEDVARYLSDLVRAPGLTLIERLPWSSVLSLWPGRITGFVDAALAAVARDQRVDAVATFDVDFARQLTTLGIDSYWPH